MKTSAKTKDLNNTIKKLDFTDICRIQHPITAEHTPFFKYTYAFTKIGHKLGFTTSLKKFKINIQIYSLFTK